MSLVDELKKLFPFVPEEVIGSLVLFVASLIAFGIGAMIIWFLPSDERMPYGNTFKLLIAITITGYIAKLIYY